MAVVLLQWHQREVCIEARSACVARRSRIIFTVRWRKANRAVVRMTETAESLSKEWLHLWNLPANTDIRGMQAQLSRLERRVASLQKEIADLEADGKRPSARRRAPVKKQTPPPPA